MPDELEISADVRTIRYDIESIKTTQQLLLRKDADDILERTVLPLFRDAKNTLLASVYKYVDGTRSQAEIVSAMVGDGIRISQPTVSRRMATLIAEGLIEQVNVESRGVVWRRKPEIESGLRLLDELNRKKIR